MRSIVTFVILSAILLAFGCKKKDSESPYTLPKFSAAIVKHTRLHNKSYMCSATCDTVYGQDTTVRLQALNDSVLLVGEELYLDLSDTFHYDNFDATNNIVHYSTKQNVIGVVNTMDYYVNIDRLFINYCWFSIGHTSYGATWLYIN